MNDPSRDLCEPFVYEEVESVCVSLKAGISSVEIDYEHIRFAGLPLRKLLFHLYQDFFMNHSFCESLMTGVILPLFKGKRAKQTIKIITEVLPCSPPFVKFMRWCSSIGWKNTQLMKVYSLTCSLALRKVLDVTILETINHMLS